MSGAAYNGDLSTVTFGFSAQSDEARHMTLGLEAIKFMLEQAEGNVAIVQGWIDKWLWRGYKVLSLVSAMMDYMLPESPMSWKEAWEIYFEENGGALFKDLERYGIKVPDFAAICAKEKDHISHQVWGILYNHTAAAAMHTWMPDDKKMDWLSEKYPDTFDKYYRPRFEHWREEEKKVIAITVRHFPVFVRPVRFQWVSPSRMIRRRLRTALRSTMAKNTISVLTPVNPFLIMNQKNTFMRGCHHNRYSRVIVAEPAWKMC
jgi:hypothetical protein